MAFISVLLQIFWQKFYRNVFGVVLYQPHEFCPNRWFWLVAMATERLNFRNKYSKILFAEAIKGMKLKLCLTVYDIGVFPFCLLPFRLLPFCLLPFRLLPFHLLSNFTSFPFRLHLCFVPYTACFSWSYGKHAEEASLDWSDSPNWIVIVVIDSFSCFLIKLLCQTKTFL